MNSITLSDLDQDLQKDTQVISKPVSALVEIATVFAMFTATSTVVLMLSLTWVR